MGIIQIYKGEDFVETKQKNTKVLAFDLDETLGSFSDLYYLWLGITTYYQQNSIVYDPTEIFNALMRKYPEFLRPGIVKILKYIYKKKVDKDCSKVFLYTNNQAHGSENSRWLHLIIQYFHERIDAQNPPLFDKIIAAFKINNRVVEPLRTTHDKIYSDFIRCTVVPKTAEICFIDNTYYDNMRNNRVYLIVPASYNHGLSKSTILSRLTNMKSYKLPDDFIQSWFSTHYIGNLKRAKNDLTVSQKLMYHIKEFFILGTKRNNKKTAKIGSHFGRFTRRKRK
jgi:hypothetical protein